MKPSHSSSEDSRSALDAPPQRGLGRIRGCLILSWLAIAFAGEFPPEKPLALALTALAVVSGTTALLFGLRHLLVRPGALLILLWMAGLALTAGIGYFRGDDPSRIFAAVLPPLLLGTGIVTTHVAACSGMRAGEVIRYFLIAAGTALLWRIGAAWQPGGAGWNHEVFLGPTLGFLIAWAACALLLRRSPVRGWSLGVFGLAVAAAIAGIFLGSPVFLIFPAAGAGLCLLLGMKWRLFPREQRWKMIAPVGILMLLGVVQVFFAGPAILAGRFVSGPLSIDAIPAMVLLLVLSLIAMGLSLRAACRNSETIMGRWARDAHLMFLPFVAVLSLLGHALVLARDPLGEPLAMTLLGFVVAMPQFFFNRAFYLRHRENEAAITPQLILNEADFPSGWEGAFPSEA